MAPPLVNILFILYGGPRCNSLNHAASFAGELTRRGHTCVIALANTDPDCGCLTHAEVVARPACFSDGRPADLIHVWTPRAPVLACVLAYQRRLTLPARVVVHLEDNERHLLAHTAGVEFAALLDWPERKLRPFLKKGLAHPVRHQLLLAAADHITGIIPSLEELSPAGTPFMSLRPGLDMQMFSNRSPDANLRASLNLRPDERVIVYPGGANFTNADELHTLYTAVVLLNHAGTPTRLIRTGPPTPWFIERLSPEERSIAGDLGFVDRSQIPALLGLADVLVQPGRPGPFNDYRLPSKLAEFLASGRPVILPPTNLALNLTDGREALFLKDGSPADICARCREIFANPELGARLGLAGRRFAENYFDARVNTAALERLYQDILARPPAADWTLLKTRFHEESDLFPLSSARDVPTELLKRAAKRRAGNWPARLFEHNPFPGKSRNPAAPVQATVEHPPHRVQFTRNPLTVSGWCRDANGVAAGKVRVRLGNRIIPCTPHQDTGRFSTSFRTRLGLKHCVIEAESTGGDWFEIGRRSAFVYANEDTSDHYTNWLKQHDLINPPLPPPAQGPMISVLMPVYNPPERWLRRAIESVRAQTYPHWQLCIADDASTLPHVRKILAACAAQDSRIRIIHRTVNGHISVASNSALELATGEFTALLDHDDELAPHALAEIARVVAARPATRILYSDEDKIDAHGRRYSPYFKPDWNPDLLRGQNYFCHLTAYHTALLRKTGGFRTGYEGAQDWDLALRAVEHVSDDQIVHIPRVLYHWRAIRGSTALGQSQKNYHQDAARKSLESFIARNHLDATAEPVRGGHWRIRYRLPDPAPRVSIIIPTRDRLEFLRPCVESILKKTRYPDYELLIVDNGSVDPATLGYLDALQSNPRIKILRDDGPFNYSALNNRAAARATGTILAFVNNDIDPISPDWLGEMTSLALRPGTGAVGALLYFPDDRVQHAGVILGISGSAGATGVAGHAFKDFARGDGGNMNRLRLVQNYSAVTAACLVIRREIFTQVGGFDEAHLPVSFNDVDLCLRVLRAGHRNVWTPFAELYHHESASRGADNSPDKKARAALEIAHMRATWGPFLDSDPAYNPNLTLVYADCSPSWPPRAPSCTQGMKELA